MRLVALCALLLSAPGCLTEVHSTPIGEQSAAPVTAHPERAWEVVQDGAVVGIVVEFACAAEPSLGWFSVRNRHQQELGMVDSAGRAYRHLPHQREAEWLGTGTVFQGVRRILEADEAVELVEVQLAVLTSEAQPEAGSRP